MFEKDMKIALLLDVYGDVLDDHTRQIMRAYYEDDLSLAEIAAESGSEISRQGVRHVIKRGEDRLAFLESKLGLCEREAALSDLSEKLRKIAGELAGSSDPRTTELAKELSDLVTVILK